MTTESLQQSLNSTLEGVANSLDLTDAQDLARVTELAEEILSLEADPNKLEMLEQDLCGEKEKVPLVGHLAAKIARSRALVARITEPVFVSVVFAVYKEHERILSSEEHEHGEDFLRRKVDQLQWLFGTHPNFDWELVVVDDGCPEGSGAIAQQIAERESLTDRVRTLHLSAAIEQRLPVVAPMTDTSESQKGGSVAYGMWEVVQQERTNHIVVFTDADLSTHLGQIGLVVDPIIRRGADAAIGSRREPTSIAIKQGTRNTRGKLFIYLWKQLFPLLGDVVDTQCGFKAFRATGVEALTSKMIEKKFAFDIELLLRTEIARSGSIQKCAIAWIDSEAASTTTSLQPYLSMLQQMAKMYRAYLQPTDKATAFADLIDALDDERWDRLCENVPAGIADREPAEFGRWAEISPTELLAVARGE